MNRRKRRVLARSGDPRNRALVEEIEKLREMTVRAAARTTPRTPAEKQAMGKLKAEIDRVLADAERDGADRQERQERMLEVFRRAARTWPVVG